MKVNLDDIITSLESSDGENKSYLNKKTGQILWSMESNPEYSTYNEKDENNSNIIHMFGLKSKSDYAIMKEFIKLIKDKKISDDLSNKIKQKNPFKNFKSSLIYYNIEKDWYKFRDNKYRMIAIEWCKKNNIEYF